MGRVIFRRWVCFIYTALASACVSTTPTGPLEPEPVFLRPPLPIDFSINGCYTGALVDWHAVDDGHDWTVTPADLALYQEAAGKKTAFLLAYSAFSQGGKPIFFPAAFCHFARAHDAVPYLTWEPRDWDANSPRSKTQSLLPEILAGEWDKHLDGWIKGVSDYGSPLILRFGHEFNGDWYPWSGVYNGGGGSGRFRDPDRTDGPRVYIEAYRYVFQRFYQAGVRNVVWAWSPNFEARPAGAWNHYRHYFPGDGMVDLIALDVYNWGASRDWSRWQSFEESYGDFYRDVSALYPTKPIMIGEFGCSNKGGDKAAWFTDAFRTLKEKFRRTKIFTYFNVDHTSSEGIDFRFDADPAAARAMREALRDPYFIEQAILK